MAFQIPPVIKPRGKELFAACAEIATKIPDTSGLSLDLRTLPVSVFLLVRMKRSDCKSHFCLLLSFA